MTLADEERIRRVRLCSAPTPASPVGEGRGRRSRVRSGDRWPAAGIASDLGAIVGEQNVCVPPPAEHLHDATESRAVGGSALASTYPQNAEQVAGIVRWCAARGVAVVPRGGGTGYAAGAVPAGEAVVVATERLSGPGRVVPEAWRATFPAGMRTAELQRRCREAGLFFAPNPGSAESCFIGGNVATNAGGPRSFRYGPTRAWVSGLEAVLGDGRIVRLGGEARKNVETVDLVGLLCGSEGTLGVITEVTLKLQPAPELELPVLALYGEREAGLDALAAAMASGVVAAALEFIEARALQASRLAAPVNDARFAVLAEALGSEAVARAEAAALQDALAPGALAVVTPQTRRDAAALWRWRDGVSLAVTAVHGGKLSEDITVPTERLGEALAAIDRIGLEAGVEVTAWGHAGDGNIHATVMVDHSDREALLGAQAAADRFLEIPAALGGALSGEHGIGRIKLSAAGARPGRDVAMLQRALKAVFDPLGILNPGVKIPRERREDVSAAGVGPAGQATVRR
jgi:FAD/FMN-containing dehydrogenase